MEEYQEKTGRKMIRGTKKLLGVMSALLKWSLSHGLKVTAIHKYIKYESGKPSSWFPIEVTQARCNANNDPTKKKSGDTSKLKGVLFYGKIIKNFVKQEETTFTTNELLVD